MKIGGAMKRFLSFIIILFSLSLLYANNTICIPSSSGIDQFLGLSASLARPLYPEEHSEPFSFIYDDGYASLRLTYYSIGVCEALRVQALHACSLSAVEFFVAGPGSLEVNIWAVDSARTPTITRLIDPFVVWIDSTTYASWRRITLPRKIYLAPFEECAVGRKLLSTTGPILFLSPMVDIEERSFILDPGVRRWLQPTYTDSLGARWIVTYLIRAYGTYYNVPDADEIYFQCDSTSISTTHRGVAFCDLDRDGDMDLSTGSQIFRNNSGVFSVATGTGITGTGYPYWGDFDMNGSPDVFLAGGVYQDRLFANSGTGSVFYDVTSPAGSLSNPYYTDAVAWLDFDKDGDLDMYVANSQFYDTIDSVYIYFPDLFYRNEGAYFVEATEAVGMGFMFHARQYGSGIALGDWNNDGWTDIYVANGANFPNYLWQNMGDGTFTEVAFFFGCDGINDGGGIYGHSIGACFGDIDNDMDLDLFVANETPFRGYTTADPSLLYINQGPPFYFMLDEAWARGIKFYPKQSIPTFLDFDNDGWLDLIITGLVNGNYAFVYQNNGDGTFTDITERAGIILANGSGVAYADIDKDGDLDIVIEKGNTKYIYRNQYDLVSGMTNGWVRFRCEGRDANKLGIGTRIYLHANGFWQMREIGTQYGSVRSQCEPIAHFGLGSSHIADTIIVRWNSGTVETLLNVLCDTMYHLLEGTHLVDERPLPASFDIIAYPNPFNSSIAFDFRGATLRSSLSGSNASERICVEIFDVNGRLVHGNPLAPVRVSEETRTGVAPLIWTPKKELSSGVYLAKINIGRWSSLVRVVYLK